MVPGTEQSGPEHADDRVGRRDKALLPLLKANGVGLGNSPFVELESDEAAINRTENGCLVQKPNLRKTMAYLRSNLFNPFDQVTYFHDVERQLPPELEPFFDRYGFRKVLRPALAVANAQRQAVGSQFAPLALYVDHTHLSKLGVELLLPRLADRG